MGITLHKSGTHPDARGDNGTSRFRYALYPHKGALGVDTIKQGYDFNMLPVATTRKNLASPFAVDGDKAVVVETVKQGEDGGIVRDVPVSFDPSRREYAYRRVKERFLHKDEESDHDPMAELED